jgi:cytidine deaminase
VANPVDEELVARALAMRARAYAPYSRFTVGASLRCADGTVVDGCNVENASYGLCICGERTAIAAAVAQGHQRFTQIAVATGASPPASPCGMCRQVLAEFAVDADIDVVLVNDAGERVVTSVRALLPLSFHHAQLTSGQS